MPYPIVYYSIARNDYSKYLGRNFPKKTHDCCVKYADDSDREHSYPFVEACHCNIATTVGVLTFTRKYSNINQVRWVKFIPLHMPFILKPNSTKSIKIY